MFRDIDSRIQRAMAAVRRPFRMLIAAVNSAPDVQLASGEGLKDEPLSEAELLQHYGFTSRPPGGTMGVVVPLGGRTSHGVVIATEHASYRLKALQTGEVAIYTDEGAKIVLKRGRIIETDCDVFRVNCKTWEVNATETSAFNTPTLTASDQVIVKDKLTGEGGMAMKNKNGGRAAEMEGGLHTTEDIVAGNISLMNHDHNETGTKTLKPNPTA